MKDEDKKMEELKKNMARPIKAGEDKEGVKQKFIAAEVLPDGLIVEMLYDRSVPRTCFAVGKGDKFETKDFVDTGAIRLVPYSPHKDFITNDVVLFPSEVAEYGKTADLVQDVQQFIHEYLAVSPFFERMASWYVLFSWLYDEFNELPYLRALGDYGTGKSRFLNVIGSVCYRPIFTGGATTVSPIFRMLNDIRGTLVMDEADLRFSDTTADLVKIFNSGFAKGSPVLRSESGNGKSFDVKAFNVFGPKLLATRRLFEDRALESRMITEETTYNKMRDDIPINIPPEFYEKAQILRNKLLLFRFRNKGKVVLRTDLVDRSIEPRLNQVAVPIMSLIEEEHVIKEFQQQLCEYNDNMKSDRSLDEGYQVIVAVVRLREQGNWEPTVKQISDQVNQDQEGDPDWLTPKRVGVILRRCLNLKTKRTRYGFILLRDNTKKVDWLIDRMGIEVMEPVNIVNDVNDIKEETNLSQQDTLPL